jgi:hypothetical protein
MRRRKTRFMNIIVVDMWLVFDQALDGRNTYGLSASALMGKIYILEHR